MKAAAVLGKRDIRVVDVSQPVVADDGVLIKVNTCGICGSDLHVYKSNLLLEDSTKLIDGYKVIGHEFVGEITDIGSGVKDFQVGDRVVSVHNKGGMAEYIEVHGERLRNLFKIPPHLTFETATTLEPLCNPMHSFHLREPKDNETVALFGLGIIGLGYLQIVKAYTDAKIIAIDVSRIRLEMAKKLGAETAINAREEDPVRKIKELTGDHYVRYQDKTAGGCDISVDCAGIPLTFQQALESLKPIGGTAVISAIYEGDVDVDPNMIVFKYMAILGSMGYSEAETREALDLLASGRVNRDILITHRFPLERVDEAFAVQANADKSIKVLIKSKMN
ncbi:zinc-dependent alcohol dehydrogenase [[Eubacterium] cellulosolvens]